MVGHFMMFTQQKPYFKFDSKGVKIKIVYASNPDHLLHISYPYPLDQRGLADEHGNFNLFQKVSHGTVTTNDSQPILNHCLGLNSLDQC